jgi:hypothetical protein
MNTKKPTPQARLTNKKNPAPLSPEALLKVDDTAAITAKPGSPPKEHKGYADQGLLEPTRYGDWDVKGRCSDF